MTRAGAQRGAGTGRGGAGARGHGGAGTGHGGAAEVQERAFLDRIAQGVVLADGAYGTMLDAFAGLGPCELLNLEDRRRVEELHLAYIRAGARAIQTNTFAANRLQLSPFGLAHRVWELNVWGAKIARAAREVAGEPVLVGGTLGPLAALPAERAELPEEDMRAAYREQVEALLAGGVDFFLVESQSDARQAAAAVAAVRAACRLPVVVTFSFAEGDRTLAGQSPREVLAVLASRCRPMPEVLGVNCGLGPGHALRMVRALRRAGWRGPMAASPNAGPLVRVVGSLEYRGTPADFARVVPELVAAGVRYLGGCCGTTPEYVRAAGQALARMGVLAGEAGRERDPRDGDAAVVPSGPSGGAVGGPAGRAAVPDPAGAVGGDAAVHAGTAARVQEAPAIASPGGPSPAGDLPPGPRLRDKLGRQFVISVELDPPRGTVVRKFLADARRLRDAGVDCINVGDSPMARVRMGAIAGAYLIQREAGVETIVHFTTRDRNLMAIQADLLSAHALGLRNVLALTGDNPRLGNTRASPVYDVDSVGLLQILAGLNRGRDIAGNPIGEPTDFTLACALSPNAEDLDAELERFRRKVEAGARFAMTQPLYELAPLERVLDRLGGSPVPLLLGVMPLHSYKHAVYLHTEVPGISIPRHVLEAMERAGDRGLEAGMELAERIVEQARPWIAGIYVVPSFGKVEPVARFVERLRAAGYGAARQRAAP